MTLAWIEIRSVLIGAVGVALVWWGATAIAWCEAPRGTTATQIGDAGR